MISMNDIKMYIKKKRIKELCDKFGYSISNGHGYDLIGAESPSLCSIEYFLIMYGTETDEDYHIKRDCTINYCYPTMRTEGKIVFAFTFSGYYSNENVIDVVQKYNIKCNINHLDNELELIKYFKQIKNMIRLAEKYQKEDMINQKKESLSGDFICD